MTYYPWWYMAPPKPVGMRVWRAYFVGRKSFCFGLSEDHDAADAKRHAAQWGEVLEVEPVT